MTQSAGNRIAELTGSTRNTRSAFASAMFLASAALMASGCSEAALSNADNAQASGQKKAASAPQDRFAGVEIKAEQVRPGISVLFGQGGNIAISHGADGTVMIDDQFAPLSEKIQAAIAKLGADPVKYLVNTHWHGDHSGGNENFGKAGALIMAHDNVRIRLAGEQQQGRGSDPASPKEALPVISYDKGMKLHLNGDTIRLIHIPHAHTDGDTVLYWEQANVVHMGDTFFNKVTLPFIDLNSGGNISGFITSAETVLALADEDTVIIPGHGPISDRAGLQAYLDMLRQVRDSVAKAMDEGKTLEQIKALKPAAKWDTNPDGFIKGDGFVEAVYNSLKQQDDSGE